QHTISAVVSTSPGAHQQRYSDYWGTRVVAFDVPEPHTGLEIKLDAIVDTLAAPGSPEPGNRDTSWTDLTAAAGELDEFLLPTPYTRAPGELEAVAATLRSSRPHDTV